MSSALTAALIDSGLGLRRGVVDLAPPSAAWATAFARVSTVLSGTAPTSVVSIDHIGSTAVQGLPAKPILDIAIAVAPDADVDELDAWLVDAGFLFRGDRNEVRPDRMYGYEVEEPIRAINLHLVLHDGPEWRHYLAFRDHLRAHDGDRDAYGALKLGLAAQHPDDRLAYIDGKEGFIVARR